VTYNVVSRLDEGYVEAKVSLPPRPGATVRLRLRLPSAYRAERAQALDRPDLVVELEGDLVKFPPQALGNVTLRVWCPKEEGD
jgi:hypothetical protein